MKRFVSVMLSVSAVPGGAVAYQQPYQQQPQMMYQQPAPQQGAMMAVQPQDMQEQQMSPQPQMVATQAQPVQYVLKRKKKKKAAPVKKTAVTKSSSSTKSTTKPASGSVKSKTIKEPIRVSKKDLEEGKLPRPFVSSGTSKLSLKVLGQVNRMFALRNNGAQTRFDSLDSTASSSRINVTGTGRIDHQTAIDGVIEVEYQDAVGAQYANLGNTPAGSVFSDQGHAMRCRRIEAVLKHDIYGTVFAGLGSTSSDGTAEVDLSGTTAASLGSEAPFDTGGFQYLNKDTNQVGSRFAFDAFNKFDALSRTERIRYDSPTFGGVVVGFTYGNQDQSDQTIKYSAQIGKTKVGAAIAHSYQPFLIVRVPVGSPEVSVPDSGNDYRRTSHIYTGSFSVLHEGFSFGAAYGNRHFKIPPVNQQRRKPAKMWFLKAGYQTHLIDCGLSAFAFDFGRAKANSLFENNFSIVNNERSISYGFTALQNFDPAATELYFVARRYLLENGTAKFHDAFVFFLGARIKF